MTTETLAYVVGVIIIVWLIGRAVIRYKFESVRGGKP